MQTPNPPYPYPPNDPIPCVDIAKPSYELTTSISAEEFEVVHAHYQHEAERLWREAHLKGWTDREEAGKPT
jgi:hypothetical protein